MTYSEKAVICKPDHTSTYLQDCEKILLCCLKNLIYEKNKKQNKTKNLVYGILL